MQNRIECVDYLTLLYSIPDNSVDLVITDPPFGISYRNNYTSRPYDIIKNDDKPFEYDLLGKEVFRVLKPESAVFCYTGWSEYPRHVTQFKRAGLDMKEPLIVQKRPSGTHDLYGTFQSNADWIMFGHKGQFKFRKTELKKNKRAGTIPNKGRKPVPEYTTRMTSCWFGEEYPYSSENSSFQKANDVYHPTIKGLNLMEWLILMSTDEGGIVVDPFVGSGTVAVACQRHNRNYVVGDIDQSHISTTLDRIKRNL